MTKSRLPAALWPKRSETEAAANQPTTVERRRQGPLFAKAKTPKAVQVASKSEPSKAPVPMPTPDRPVVKKTPKVNSDIRLVAHQETKSDNPPVLAGVALGQAKSLKSGSRATAEVQADAESGPSTIVQAAGLAPPRRIEIDSASTPALRPSMKPQEPLVPAAVPGASASAEFTPPPMPTAPQIEAHEVGADDGGVPTLLPVTPGIKSMKTSVVRHETAKPPTEPSITESVSVAADLPTPTVVPSAPNDFQLDQPAPPPPPVGVDAVESNAPTTLVAPTESAPASSSQSLLDLENLAFCTQVRGFGDVDPLRTQVVAGQRLLLYTEVKGFFAVMTDTGYETKLSTRVTIERIDGKVLAPLDFPDIIDQCQSRRSDFFCHYRFQLPKDLPEGRYLVRLRVHDQHGQSACERTIDLTVTNPNLVK